ncbi:MAG: M48 family metalloprotease [Pseudoxanthomonas sp.]
MRPCLLAAVLTVLAAVSTLAAAQVDRLPDIGSSAGELLTPAKQAEYGAMTLRELRNYGYVLDDPLIDQWLDRVGQKLAAASATPGQRFTFFMLRDRQINAFATLGGYIAVNSGLVLTAEREDEVAAVLSHEIAHVSQQHVLRSVERAKRDQVPILLGMIAAIAAAQAAGGNSAGDATQAAVASGLGLMVQRQIDFTRSNESEADRLGIQTLARAGYDPDAMADFFARMDQTMRGNRGGDRDSTPDFLQTHPVTTTRISEAHDRAEQIKRASRRTATVSTPGGTLTERIPSDDYAAGPVTSTNPLLPFRVTLDGGEPGSGPSGVFDWAHERLRVLTANTAQAAVGEYEAIRRNTGTLTEAQRYGLALARLYNDNPAAAQAELEPLLAAHPGDSWLGLAMAEAEAKRGHDAAADQRFQALQRHDPDNRAIALTWATVLDARGSAAAGRQALAVLRPLQDRSGGDIVFQRAWARACELAGDGARAGEAWAEATYLGGRAEQALVQLQTLKQRPDLDYYARARIDARIAQLTPEVLELRQQGVRDPDLGRR